MKTQYGKRINIVRNDKEAQSNVLVDRSLMKERNNLKKDVESEQKTTR